MVMKRLNVLLVLLLSAGVSVYAQKKCVPSEEFTVPVLQEEAAPSCAAPKEVEPTKFDNWFIEGWGMNMSFGPTIYVGDVSKSSKVKAMIGLGVQKELNPHIYWRLNGAYGQLSGEKDKYESGGDANLKFSNKFTEINTSLKFNLAPEKKISPYLYTGVGLINFRSKLSNSQSGKLISSYGYKGNTASSATHEVEVPLGLGFDWNINQAFSMNLDGSMRIVKSDKLDACVSDNNDKLLQDMFGAITVGFAYKFGYRDCDKDGVVNRKDKCPDTPYGIAVDENGCPFDTDHDGIPDFEDKCPNEAGLAEFQGCPDSDGDGIPDYEDRCPNEAGLAEFKGCPDSDGDGIPDVDDKCPNEAGLAEFQGCPDTDGDGIPDYDDKCPDKYGLAKYDGCPDTDGDGVPDHLDNCPDVAGTAKNNGCPAVKKEVLKIFEKALTGIQFETGKAIIKKQSYPILNDVVKAMKENPEYNLEINGHTDNVGDSAKNMKLSEDRAASVRKYLIDNGVQDVRMVSHGYGDTRPIADNSTKEGKAKNRRVEFKVVFQKLEVEEEK
jgi:outer membrane protein OmpA-like peptidoglycan-associated protein